jgi:hypothetical protein
MKFIALLLTLFLAFPLNVLATVSPIFEGTIKCTNYPASYPDQYQSRWGYLNSESVDVVEPVGNNNKITGGSSNDLGQPTTFIPGRQINVFRTAIVPGQLLVWRLFNKTATATVPSADKERVCIS